MTKTLLFAVAALVFGVLAVVVPDRLFPPEMNYRTISAFGEAFRGFVLGSFRFAMGAFAGLALAAGLSSLGGGGARRPVALVVSSLFAMGVIARLGIRLPRPDALPFRRLARGASPLGRDETRPALPRGGGVGGGRTGRPRGLRRGAPLRPGAGDAQRRPRRPGGVDARRSRSTSKGRRGAGGSRVRRRFRSRRRARVPSSVPPRSRLAGRRIGLDSSGTPSGAERRLHTTSPSGRTAETGGLHLSLRRQGTTPPVRRRKR